MLSLEELRQRAIVIEGDCADELRRRFIQRFVDTDCDYYKQRIATRTRFRDGMFPTGYLWDCLKQSERIPLEAFWDRSLLENTVYVLWDPLSSEQVRIKDYWKFPKHSALKLKYRDALAGRAYLPEDIYIFSDDLDYCLDFTHETDSRNAPLYFRAVAHT